MRFNSKTLVWCAVLGIACFLASAAPAQAQSMSCFDSSVCNSNVDCGTSCDVPGPCPPGEIQGVDGCTRSTTCGAEGRPCCTPTTTVTTYCTGQFLNSNFTCVQVERDLVTTTCGTNSSSTIVGQRQRSPNATCATCPTEHTPGCEDLVSPVCG
jgi:hypothetical protein